MSDMHISIDGEQTDLKDAINVFRAGEGDGILQSIIASLMARKYAEKHGVSVSEENIGEAMDELRYMGGLEKADAFRQILKDRNLSIASLQAGTETRILKGKSIDAIPDDEVRQYITENMLVMEEAEIYSIRLDDEQTAKEVKALLDDKDEPAGFLALAEEYSKDEATRKQGGYVGFLNRKMMTGEIEAAVFNAKEGDIVGPIKTEKSYNIFKVASFRRPGVEDRELAGRIRALLYERKIAEMTSKAKIECSLFE